mmetsp:Transcript_19734/g.32146  ORF Transcript_19734/g.32146 Transcript_19734/m.32146 type:complete len:246 (-) Transcript_19734:711-1448(-)
MAIPADQDAAPSACAPFTLQPRARMLPAVLQGPSKHHATHQDRPSCVQVLLVVTSFYRLFVSPEASIAELSTTSKATKKHVTWAVWRVWHLSIQLHLLSHLYGSAVKQNLLVGTWIQQVPQVLHRRIGCIRHQLPGVHGGAAHGHIAEPGAGTFQAEDPFTSGRNVPSAVAQDQPCNFPSFTIDVQFHGFMEAGRCRVTPAPGEAWRCWLLGNRRRHRDDREIGKVLIRSGLCPKGPVQPLGNCP